ncbi:MAG: excinuclease ABC subunit UvrC [Thermoleophilia bacterium]
MTNEITSARTKRLLDSLPDLPGVYIFRDSSGKVLYVGKAKSLRKRVMSYFRKSGPRESDKRISRMLKRMHDFDFMTTTNETEALLLEANFIKHHRPPFNIMLRDDKSYPYVAITLDEEFPRVTLTRKPHRRRVAYFGPFVSAGKLRETLDLLGRIFPYRKCRGAVPGRRSGTPCLNFHIGLCLAPCDGRVDPVTYRKLINKVERLMAGKPEGLVEEITGAMEAAAALQHFEEAALWRNRLRALQHLLEKQQATAIGLDSLDVIGVYSEDDTANVQVLQVRDGNLVDRRSFFLKNAAGESEEAVIEQFIIQYYSTPIGLPSEVVVSADLTSADMLKDLLTGQKGSRVDVRPALRGKRRNLWEMAMENAVLAWRQDRLRQADEKSRPARAMEELKAKLGLDRLPLRIECYDISNIAGEHPVGSMVVFEGGLPRKAHYRKFAVRGVSGPDDFAMMAEIIARRFKAVIPPEEANGKVSMEASGELSEAAAAQVVSSVPDESFASRPDLIVVDGGAGQVSAATAELRRMKLNNIQVIGLAKREEEIYIPGTQRPLKLPDDSVALGLLKRIRDEAHRFAITYHRQRRASASESSILDGLPGIGPARKKAILKHFGSPERFLAARSDELEAVPGLPAKIAREVYAYVNKLGRADNNDI